MSRFIISFLLFLLVNLASVRALPILNISGQPKSQEHTWTQWALIDFAKKKSNPTPIVFLGSSLMLMPINLADAHWLNRIIDGATHHESAVFDHLVNCDRKCPASNFNFALPGFMPSDAFLISRLILTGRGHPQLIIYGLGPRDFLDNLLLNPTSTDPYHCLSQYLSDPLTLSFIGQDWQARANYFFRQYMPLYKQKEQIIVATLSKVSDSMPLPPKIISMQQLHTLLPAYNPMAIRLNECLFNPNPAVETDRFTKNLDEYRQRYHRVNWDIFTCQTKFFLDFLKLTSATKVKILIAAMPITSVNRQLLPDYVYTAYKQNLRVLSKSCGADFIDLDDGGCFSDKDFVDTVHLNAAGGSKFLGLLSRYVIQHKLIDQPKSDRAKLADTGIKI